MDQLFYELYCQALVNLDACIKPEIDPNEGWVQAQSLHYDNDQLEEFKFDTQLMTLAIKPALSAGLVEWLFKPKKLNFLHSFTNRNIKPSFICGLSDPQQRIILFDKQPSHLEIKLHTLDQICLVARTFVVYHDLPITICSEFLVKAGLGAHRQNSTTGFSYTYWLESDSIIPTTHELLLRINPIMPTRKTEATEAYLLHDLSAVDQNPFRLTSLSCFADKDYPNGLHGIRLVDTISPYAMDIRSQQPLSQLNISPLYEEDMSVYYGSQIDVKTNIVQKQNKTKQNTIYISLI